MSSKRILYTATSDIHLRTFHFPYLRWLKENGFEVHVAVENRANIDLSFCDEVFYLPFKRSPLHPQNAKAYSKLKSIIASHDYSLIHCHTPAVSVMTRLAARSARRKGTKVLYTAHGYHFYKGAPLKLWLMYYPIEKFLSRFTDATVLINREDYELTKNAFKKTHAFYIKGIGIDSLRFKTLSPEQRVSVRTRLGLTTEDFVLLYIAEFIPRKNHRFLLEALVDLKKQIPGVKLVLAGRGVLLDAMKELAHRLSVIQQTLFLGWRDDVPELAGMCDVGISSSKQEGLGLGLAEEMLCHIPIVASEDRGHREMVEHGSNGYLFQQGNHQEFVQYIVDLYKDPVKRQQFGDAAYTKAQEFVIENSLLSMKAVYEAYATAQVLQADTLTVR